MAEIERNDMETAAALVPPVHKPSHKGFLPFPTNLWDRFFIGMVCLVAIHLLWLRFIEQPLQTILPHPFALLVATAISLVLLVYIMRKG
jgi:predicted small integral membrane protein